MDAYEKKFGVSIPPDYRRFLACQNGGAPVRRNFRFGKKPYQDSVLRCFLGIKSPLAFDLGLMLRRYAGRIPPTTFPIAIDEFNNLVLISRQRGSVNQVLFWDHEKELDDDKPARIATNLKAFLELLEVDQVREIEIATITFRNGETCRLEPSARFFSKDRNAVIEIRDAKIGERIEDFGEKKTIVCIVYSRERMVF